MKKLISHTSKEETQYRIDNGLLFHILLTGMTYREGSRANQYREHDYWKERVKQMDALLRAEDRVDEANLLKTSVDFYTHAQNNKMYVTVTPDAWHIFTYALRKLPDGIRDYTRIMMARGSAYRGWM